MFSCQLGIVQVVAGWHLILSKPVAGLLGLILRLRELKPSALDGFHLGSIGVNSFVLLPGFQSVGLTDLPDYFRGNFTW